MREPPTLRPRRKANLPPEKLRDVLRSIYPLEQADELYEKLMKKSNDKEKEK